MKIRIVLADDHAIVREGLKSMLQSEPDMEVVGDVGDGRTAVKLVGEKKPDIVVMDISMPDMNGIEATQQIVSKNKNTKVICLSMHQERKFVGAMLQAGAAGYVLKNDVAKELTEAIRKVVSGGVYLSPAVAGDVVKHYVRNNATRPDKGAFVELSQREREVLQLIAEGYSSKEIASKLDLSEKTVASHREHVMDKLGIHNVAELTRYALREGLSQL